MLRRLLASISPSKRQEARIEDFLDRLSALLPEVYPPPEAGERFTPGLPRRIWHAEREGRPPADGDLQAFEQVRARLRSEFASADELALRSLCDESDRSAWAQGRWPGPGYVDPRPYRGLEDTLQLWVQRHPATGAVDAVVRALEAWAGPLPPAAAQRLVWTQTQSSMEGLAATLLRLELAESGGQLHRGRGLLLRLLESTSLAAGDGTVHPGSDPLRYLYFTVARFYAPHLVDRGLLCPAELDRILLATPQLANPRQVRSSGWTVDPPLPPSWGSQVAAAVDRMMGRAASGDPNPRVGLVIWFHRQYAGIDHLLAACRAYERLSASQRGAPSARVNIEHPLSWVTSVFFTISPPDPADRERAGELAALQPDTLLAATLYAPSWADLLAPSLDWPGLAALVGWLKRYASGEAWSAYYHAEQGEEESISDAADRESALGAVAAMGEQRLGRLLKDPLARYLYRPGLYYLQALLGRNAADVEAGFVKRNKQAVRALGILPDDGDVLQRYLALRRFAKEASKFGAQRQASERLAAESGLAELAITAGFDDLAQLEWVMEARLAEEVDPTSRRWTIGDYTLRIEPTASCPVLAERAGKQLKSIPPAVRKAPDWAEITEARAELAAQFDRVRRRLELAMAVGEIFDRDSFNPALTTPAGRAMVPRLVLRCWVPGSSRPVDLLDGRSLDDEPLSLEAVERVQVVHPLHLADSGTLADWQRRLVALDLVQPFNQLFREHYRPDPAERARRETRRLAGRECLFGKLADRLKRRGWRFAEYAFERRFPSRLVAVFSTTAAPWMGAQEVAATETLSFSGPAGRWTSQSAPPGEVDTLTFSEAVRDLDLATAESAADRAARPVSPEVLASRLALVQALVPKAEPQGDLVRLGDFSLRLDTGLLLDSAGTAVDVPDVSTPPSFPYPDPAPDTVAAISGLLFSSRAQGPSGDRRA